MVKKYQFLLIVLVIISCIFVLEKKTVNVKIVNGEIVFIIPGINNIATLNRIVVSRSDDANENYWFFEVPDDVPQYEMKVPDKIVLFRNPIKYKPNENSYRPLIDGRYDGSISYNTWKVTDNKMESIKSEQILHFDFCIKKGADGKSKFCQPWKNWRLFS